MQGCRISTKEGCGTSQFGGPRQSQVAVGAPRLRHSSFHQARAASGEVRPCCPGWGSRKLLDRLRLECWVAPKPEDRTGPSLDFPAAHEDACPLQHHLRFLVSKTVSSSPLSSEAISVGSSVLARSPYLLRCGFFNLHTVKTHLVAVSEALSCSLCLVHGPHCGAHSHPHSPAASTPITSVSFTF